MLARQLRERASPTACRAASRSSRGRSRCPRCGAHDRRLRQRPGALLARCCAAAAAAAASASPPATRSPSWRWRPLFAATVAGARHGRPRPSSRSASLFCAVAGDGHAHRPRAAGDPQRGPAGRGRRSGVAIAAATDPASLPERAIAAAGAGGFLLLVALAYPRGMGMGDVKLAAVMGLYLGRAVVPGAAGRVPRRRARRARADRSATARRRASRRSRSGRSWRSAAWSACSPATRSSTGTWTPS